MILTSPVVSSSAQLKELYFLLNRERAKILGTSSRDNPFPVVIADQTIMPAHNKTISYYIDDNIMLNVCNY